MRSFYASVSPRANSLAILYSQAAIDFSAPIISRPAAKRLGAENKDYFNIEL